ncbi:MAG: YlbF family regulator [Eubacteriales bacterium]|nr:YlbF family regulator [Eubacteriales bacterium]
MTNIHDKARELAAALHESEEYAQYSKAREAAFENATTKDLLKQYRKMQTQAQAAMIAGKKDEEAMQRLQHMGEILQMDAKAAAYLMAEYRLSTLLSDVYKILGEAIDLDLSALEG